MFPYVPDRVFGIKFGAIWDAVSGADVVAVEASVRSVNVRHRHCRETEDDSPCCNSLEKRAL